MERAIFNNYILKKTTLLKNCPHGRQNLKDPQASMLGQVDSIEAAMTVMKEYELETTTKFSSFKPDSKFGAVGN